MPKRCIAVLFIVLFSFVPLFSTSFLDSEGRLVDVKSIENTACLNSSLADLWHLAGGNVSITIKDAIEKGYAPQDAFLVDNGAGIHIDEEMLIYNKPDFVLASPDTPSHVKAVEKLERLNIPAALIRLESFGDFYHYFSILTDLTGRKDLFEIHGEGQKVRIEEIISKAQKVEEKPSVLFVRCGSGFSSTRAKTKDEHFAAKILADLGAHNIAEDVPVLSESLALESVLVCDPDLILIVPQGNEEASIAYMRSLLDKPGWRNLKAVEEDKVFFLPKDLFHYKPNGRWAESYFFLASILYPGVFDEK